MRANDLLYEADLLSKILQDPKTTKMLALAMKHDSAFPRQDIADLGPRPLDKEYAMLWNQELNKILANNDYGDLSKDGKFDQWLLRQYINHVIDYEDLSGEAGDTLGAWQALSKRGQLDPKDQDFNRFPSLHHLQQAMNKSQYRDSLRRIKDEELIEKHKRTKKEVVLIDNERFKVAIPMNWGACYTFNNQTGHISNFCTGGSSGLHWFNRYAPDGPLVMITDKQNINNKNGKWQLHAPTNQLVNSMQEQRGGRGEGDKQFAQYFPGLLREICKAMLAKENQIMAASKEIDEPNGYDVRQAVKEIIAKFPLSYKSTSRNKAVAIPQDDEEVLGNRIEVQPVPQAQQAAPSIQPEVWTLVYAGRNMGDTEPMTPQQVRQYLTNYARQNRWAPGRVYAMSDDQERIVRI